MIEEDILVHILVEPYDAKLDCPVINNTEVSIQLIQYCNCKYNR